MLTQCMRWTVILAQYIRMGRHADSVHEMNSHTGSVHQNGQTCWFSAWDGQSYWLSTSQWADMPGSPFSWPTGCGGQGHGTVSVNQTCDVGLTRRLSQSVTLTLQAKVLVDKALEVLSEPSWLLAWTCVTIYRNKIFTYHFTINEPSILCLSSTMVNKWTQYIMSNLYHGQ